MTSLHAQSPPDDPLGAFCRENHVALEGAPDGPLAGLTFAAKDVFHIAGHRTGFGQPDWLRTHPPAEVTAEAVRRLLDAGAHMAGKTHTDELTYSLSGQNVHYGTPVNSAAPDRIPGGSSNGSVSAVAGGLVDFALGTDCGGSVRLPASYCGVLGIRPSHGRVSLDGVVPFASSFDVAGWFARDADVFSRVGTVLLGDDADATEPAAPRRLLYARDAFDLVDSRVRDAFEGSVAKAAAAIGTREDVVVSPDGLADWYETFRVLQAAEIWSNLGAWVQSVKPSFGPGIRERFELASQVKEEDVVSAKAKREAIRGRMDELLKKGDILCLPTSPRVAPLKDAPSDDLEIQVRQQAMSLLCIAGLAGLPQVSLPLATLDGLPLGFSLIARRGADAQLLALAKVLMAEG
jgi:amidase